MVTALALLALIYFLLNSEWGASFVLKRVNNYLVENTSMRFSYGSLSGTLGKGLSFTDFYFDNEQMSIQTESLAASWSLWALLNKEIRLQTLDLNVLTFQQFNNEATTQEDTVDITDLLADLFNLPFSIRIRSLELVASTFLLAQQNLEFNRISADFSLNSEALAINDLSIMSDDYDVEASFALQANDFLIDGNVDWQLYSSVTESIGSGDFTGELFFSGDINSLEISHELLQPILLESNGSLSTGIIDGTGLNFSFEHSLENLSELTPLPQIVSSVTGSLLTHGSSDLIFLDADLDIQSSDFLPVELLLSGEYQNQGINFETISAISPEINLFAIAELTTQPFAFEADWQLNELSLDNYLNTFTLDEVNGGGSIYTDAEGNTTLNLSFLDGNLNNYPLTAAGEISLSDNALSAVDLLINTSNNRLSLNGAITETIAVNWLVEAPELAVWLPALRGEVQGSGVINGELNNPVISGNLTAENLDYQSNDTWFKLENLRADIVTRQDDYRFNFSASNLDAEVAGAQLQATESQLNLTGNLSDHQGELSLTGDEIELALAFNGNYSNNNWTSLIQNGVLDAGYGRWELQNEMDLMLARESVSISQHCWSYLNTELCLNGNIAAQNFLFEASVNNFPLAYMNTTEIVRQVDDVELSRIFSSKPQGLTDIQNRRAYYLPANTYVLGSLAAQFSAQGNLGAVQETSFTLDMQPETLELNLFVPQEDDNQSVQPDIRTFAISSENLSFSRNNDVLTSNVELSIYHLESTGLDVQGDLGFMASMDPMQNLQGELQLDFSSLDWLEAILPEVRNTRGDLAGRLQLSGTLNQPKFISNLELNNGSFELPEYGISPEQISIDFSSDANQSLLIRATATSGEGQIDLNGNAASLYSSNRNFDLVLQGENFVLINNPGTKLLINPDVRLSFEAGILDLQGQVAIPEMELDIRDNSTVLLSEGVDVSRDVVIVNAPEDQAQLVNNSQRNITEIPVTADLELVLGEKVHFQGLGLDLTLNGDLQLQQELNRPFLTYGDISITQGAYEIYGQGLDVANGKLIFFGNIVNPALDIRAYRQGSDIQAGVQINGTLRNMQSQLFSTPTLPDSEILSILITGKSFNDTDSVEQGNLLGAITSLGINRGQGGFANTIRDQLGLDALALNSQADLQQSSLGLGKYITPNIFMTYEIGLYEKESVLSLDYILNDRLRLEVESGISQSIDMTYTIEK